MAPTRKPRKATEPVGEPDLLVPMASFEEKLDDRIALGEELRSREPQSESDLKSARQAYYSWTEFNNTLLLRSFSTSKIANGYSSTPGFAVLGGGPDPLHVQVKEFHDDVEKKLRRLRSIKDQLPLYGDGLASANPAERQPASGTDVFIVHGHHDALKQQVARTVERLTGRDPIILHEQADSGRTIIEKFESYAQEAGFAIILLTADDVGGVMNDDEMRPRARQNVVFELGYFVGRLGRPRVAVLYDPGVELPSDMSGVLYTVADEAGAWRLKLAQEMRAAGLETDFNKLA